MSQAIIFNITFKLSGDLAAPWANHVKLNLLPEITDGNIITATQLNKVLVEQDDGDETFAIQFNYTSAEVFKEHKLSTMAQFLKGMDEQFRGQYVYFATMMELIHQQS